MGRSFIIAMRYLIPLFIVTNGWSVSGCSDSASVNPVVELSSLTITAGSSPTTLQPSFSPATTNYTVELSNSTTSVTVTAQPAVAGDSVTINGEVTTSRPIALGGAGTTTPVNIVVSESGSNSRTYTVLLIKASLTGNNSLRSLLISPGTLTPRFNANAQNYQVSVASSVASMRVTPTVDDPAATVTVNGQPANSGQAQTIPLNEAGSTTPINIVVTAPNSSQKPYTITVARAALSGNNNLQNLTVSPSRLDPTFSESRTSYTVSVDGRVDSITVTATPQDTNARTTINDQDTNSRSIALPVGPSNTEVQVIVTAPNGVSKTYFISVNRAALSANNNLSELNVTPSTLTPAFTADQLTYTMDVATDISSVSVSATKADPNAVISGDVPNQGSARIPLDGPGTSKTVSITVTAPNGSAKTYVIIVTRLAPSTDSNLQNLTVSAGTLNPGFATGTQSYTVTVPSGIDSLTVIATKSDPNAVLSSSGSVIAPAGVLTGSVSSSLGLGTTTVFAISVTAQDGVSTKPYTISVFRELR